MIVSALLTSIPGIVHGFGTAEQLVPPALASAWSNRPQKTQIHSASVVQVEHAHQQCGQADAFVTASAGVPVSVITADCVPVLLARRDGGAVAAIHAGWRGLIGGILPNVLHHLTQRGERAQEWVGAIGPAVCGQCYEVSPELAAQFVAHFAALPADLVRPQARHLDLPAIAKAQLHTLGLAEVERLPLCTACSCDAHGQRRFRSYRQGDRGAQQHSGLLIVEREAAR